MQNNSINNSHHHLTTTKRTVGRVIRLGVSGAVATTIGLFAAAAPASASTCSAAQDLGFLGGVYVAAGDVDGDVDGRDFLVWQRSTGSTTTDSFGFGVEREMKESGEKGGTADINIGVGELQECTISKSMDMASPKLTQFAINGNPLGAADADATGSAVPLGSLGYDLERV